MSRFVFLALVFLSTNSFSESVVSDEQLLRKLNSEIAGAEDRGDRKWLENILAPELSFRRANGVVIGKEQFLRDIKPRGPSKTEIETIKIYGSARAVVTCIVTLKIDGQDEKFHNIRMFVRQKKDWKLMGWANERI